MRVLLLLFVLAGTAMAGCLNDSDFEAPPQESLTADAGAIHLDVVAPAVTGSFHSTFQAAGAAPSAPVPVMAPGVPGSYMLDVTVNDLPSLPEGLAYQGWLVKVGEGTLVEMMTGQTAPDTLPLAKGPQHKVPLDLFAPTEPNGTTYTQQWAASENYQDHMVVGVTIEPDDPSNTEDRLVLAMGPSSLTSPDGKMMPTGVFDGVTVDARVDDNGTLHFTASGLPYANAEGTPFGVIGYGAWAKTTDDDWILLGVEADTEGFHVMQSGVPPLRVVELTIETAGSTPDHPSGFVVAAAEV